VSHRADEIRNIANVSCFSYSFLIKDRFFFQLLDGSTVRFAEYGGYFKHSCFAKVYMIGASSL